MHKRVVTLLAVLFLLLPASVNMAAAGGPPGEGGNPPNQTGPEGKPCNADHGHADRGLANNPRCEEADTDTDTDTDNQCTAATGDPGLLTDDTLGQTLWDGGLQIEPLTEDPEANGPLSGGLRDGGEGSPIEVVTDEAGCAVDLLIDESTGLDL